MSSVDRCSWKMVSPDKFVLGQIADRCGTVADVVVLRPNRKTDLFLCEDHLNEFIAHWGLHNSIEVLCRCEESFNDAHLSLSWNVVTNEWNKANGIDWDDIPAPQIKHPWPDYVCDCPVQCPGTKRSGRMHGDH